MHRETYRDGHNQTDTNRQPHRDIGREYKQRDKDRHTHRDGQTETFTEAHEHRQRQMDRHRRAQTERHDRQRWTDTY